MITKTSCFPISCVLLCAASGLMAQQKVLVVCEGGACEYRRVAAIMVGGKRTVRTLKPVDPANAPDVKMGQEIPIENLPGLYRDPATGMVETLDEDGTPETVVIPSKTNSKDASQRRGAVAECRHRISRYAQSQKRHGGKGGNLRSPAHGNG